MVIVDGYLADSVRTGCGLADDESKGGQAPGAPDGHPELITMGLTVQAAGEGASMRAPREEKVAFCN